MIHKQFNVAVFCNKRQLTSLLESDWASRNSISWLPLSGKIVCGATTFNFFCDPDGDRNKLVGRSFSGVIFAREVPVTLITPILKYSLPVDNYAQLQDLAREMGGMVLTC